MRVLMATVAIIALALAGTAPVGPAQASTQPAALFADLRAPDQRLLVAGAGDRNSDLRAPDQQAPAPGRSVAGGRREAGLLGLIGLSGVLVLVVGLGTRLRH
ncbi:MAG: hypothetical protein QOK49_3986 [Baekduia sp.]|nr:hypothetical protein [Baekduia sp.]